MQLNVGQVLEIIDGQQRLLGTVQVERLQGNLLCGQFRAAAGFADVAELFRQFDEAVNVQALAVLDEIDAAIAALGLQLRLSDSLRTCPIHDVQIYADGAFSCRCPVEIPGNGEPQSASKRRPVQN